MEDMSTDQFHINPKKPLPEVSDPEALRKVRLIFVSLHSPLFEAKRCVRVLLILSDSLFSAIRSIGAHFAKGNVFQHL